MKNPVTEKLFTDAIDMMAKAIHTNAKDHGFYEPPPTDSDRIALIHSEVSECLEFLRHDNPKSDHIPEFSGAEEELADAVIRILDFGAYRGYRISRAIIAKHKFNKTRPYKHGKKF